MRFIKQTSIDTIIDEARIDTVFENTETLVKKGSSFFCLSPFVTEKSPSCHVNMVKNVFFDYAAGFGGNSVSFLMKKHSIGYYEAIEKAAAICNIVLEYDDQSEDQKKINDEFLSMKKLVDFASEKYQNAFTELPLNHWAKQMMLNRGFSNQILEDFMVGFSPNEKSFISTPAINNGNFELAKNLGFTNTKDGASYDFFRNRVMFPILNEKGNIAGFGGRRGEEEEEKKYAKYMNSKESKLYQKDKVIYGLFQAKKTINTSGKAILLEGYTDVIALHQADCLNAVATCGTALTESHAKLLNRFCKHVILFRDGDAAGMRAVHRDIDILLRHGFKVEVVICPEGEDPDSLSKKEDINKFIESKKEDAILWKAKVLQQQAKHPDLVWLENDLRKDFEGSAEGLRFKLVTDELMKEMDSIQRNFAKKSNAKIFKQISDCEKDIDKQLADYPKYEPTLLAESVEGIAITLNLIPNKILQAEYVKQVAKILEQKPAQIQSIISYKEEENEKAKKATSKETDKKENEFLRLPEGANKEEYLKYRFCQIENAYWFNSGGTFYKGTNFRVEALFHVEGRQDNKRLCEVINTLGHKRLIDFESTDLINWTKFKERLIMEGFFSFEPESKGIDFMLISQKLLSDFITASELKILGQQRQGFFAFADGVYHDKSFHKVNKYGIVHVEGLEKTESEYRSDITHFYSPSHSEIYKSANEGDDPFENDRHFIHKEAPVSLDQWANQIVTVFGDKGKLGVAFCLAANFRDLFIQHYNFFPLFGGFGQKDSGKSGFGSCMQAFFYWNLNPLELNTSTLVGLSRRLTRCKNTIVFCDEMRDDIDEAMHQTLKGTWNGIGREKGKGFESNRTTVDKINSAVYYSGQYLPTRDDGALPSRSIIANFENREFSSQEKEDYNKLIAWNKTGISSFILDTIKHRDEFAKNLTKVYSETSKELKAALKDQEYQNRVFDNYLQLLVTVKMLKDKFNFPFTYENYLKLTTDSIVENSETIADSDGLAAFWRIVEYLASTPTGQHGGTPVTVVRNGEDYDIERAGSFKYSPKKNEVETFNNKDNDQILFINFSKVWQDYQKEVTKRQGEELIGMTTIRNYLKSKKYYIGPYKTRRIGSKATSGYAFNYSIMKRLGIVDFGEDDDKQITIPDIF
jgi:DNA primase catalytic core